MPSLDALAIFVKVVELGSFTRASAATGVPRSTVSARIAELEARLGTTLLLRTTRRVQLTEAGRSYHATVRSSLEAIRAAERSLRGEQGEARGRLRIAAATNMGEGIIGDAIAAFLKTYPEIEIELDLGQRRVDLIEEHFDLALRLGPLADSTSLIARPLGSIARRFMASPDFAASRRYRHPADIDPREVIAFTGETRIDLVRADSERFVLDLHPRIQANRMAAIRHQALKGLGLALLPTALTIDSAKPSSLVTVLPDWQTPESPLHIVYPQQFALPYRARLFVDFLAMAIGGSLRGSGPSGDMALDGRPQD